MTSENKQTLQEKLSEILLQKAESDSSYAYELLEEAIQARLDKLTDDELLSQYLEEN